MAAAPARGGDAVRSRAASRGPFYRSRRRRWLGQPAGAHWQRLCGIGRGQDATYAMHILHRLHGTRAPFSPTDEASAKWASMVQDAMHAILCVSRTAAVLTRTLPFLHIRLAHRYSASPRARALPFCTFNSRTALVLAPALALPAQWSAAPRPLLPAAEAPSGPSK